MIFHYTPETSKKKYHKQDSFTEGTAKKNYTIPLKRGIL